ncbi:MAG: hypothetical protein P1U89_27675 [Verrucomicrobiales bacterium]|nr:hypothetical protein [Verrucomicrobiales bacterium]
MNAISQGTHSATYGYEPNSSLVKTINHAQNSVNRLTETRVYDNLNRLRSITNLSSAASDAVAKSFTYTYNNANQRTSVNREDNTRWEYGYDALGHVTSAVKKLPDNAPLAGHQFGYSYDALGNRIAATFGGDSAGTGGLQTVSYTPNPTGDRNQYSSITHPGVVLTTGKAKVAAAVTINQQTAQDRQGEYFSHQIAVPNELGPQLIEITTEADDGTDLDSETRKEQVPPRDSSQVFDADGNLTFDGYRDWVWDAENRLISVETRETLVPLGAIPHRVEYAYDYLGRRIQRRASQKFGNRWEIVNETRYLYDGWNVIAELDGNSTTPTLIQSYLWGIDLSGTAQGAGGVGGLLAVQRHVGAKAGVHFVSYDGNGNVVALADGSDGKLSASYEYDAFGNLLEKSGVFAAANPYRFSTKPKDEVTGLYYYGYRYYDAGNGRWLNRDPIEERGGLNLYGFVGNDGVNLIDVLGLQDSKKVISIYFAIDTAAFDKYTEWTSNVQIGSTKVNHFGDTIDIPIMKVRNEYLFAIDQQMKTLNKFLIQCKCPVIAKAVPVKGRLNADIDFTGTIREIYYKSIDFKKSFDDLFPPQAKIRILITGKNHREFRTEGTKQEKNGFPTSMLEGLHVPDRNPELTPPWELYSGGMVVRVESPHTTLSHELGHFIGWYGGNDSHSSEAGNLMTQGSKGGLPDEQWCRKMRALADEIGK